MFTDIFKLELAAQVDDRETLREHPTKQPEIYEHPIDTMTGDLEV